MSQTPVIGLNAKNAEKAPVVQTSKTLKVIELPLNGHGPSSVFITSEMLDFFTSKLNEKKNKKELPNYLNTDGSYKENLLTVGAALEQISSKDRSVMKNNISNARIELARAKDSLKLLNAEADVLQSEAQEMVRSIRRDIRGYVRKDGSSLPNGHLQLELTQIFQSSTLLQRLDALHPSFDKSGYAILGKVNMQFQNPDGSLYWESPLMYMTKAYAYFAMGDREFKANSAKAAKSIITISQMREQLAAQGLYSDWMNSKNSLPADERILLWLGVNNQELVEEYPGFSMLNRRNLDKRINPENWPAIRQVLSDFIQHNISLREALEADYEQNAALHQNSADVVNLILTGMVRADRTSRNEGKASPSSGKPDSQIVQDAIKLLRNKFTLVLKSEKDFITQLKDMEKVQLEYLDMLELEFTRLPLANAKISAYREKTVQIQKAQSDVMLCVQALKHSEAMQAHLLEVENKLKLHRAQLLVQADDAAN